MELTLAHVDTFCRDNLPPQDQWPEFPFEVPEVQYPDRLNCGVELLDRVIDEHGPDRPCLRSPDGTVWTYGELRTRANQVANLLVEDHGLVPATGCCSAARTTCGSSPAGSACSGPARSWCPRCRCSAPRS